MKRLLFGIGIVVGAMLVYSGMYHLNRKFSDDPVTALTDLLQYSKSGDFDQARLLVTNKTDSTGSLVENQEEVWRSNFRFFSEINVSESRMKILKQSETSAIVLVESANASTLWKDCVFTLYKRSSAWKVHGGCMSKEAYDLLEQIASELEQEGGD